MLTAIWKFDSQKWTPIGVALWSIFLWWLFSPGVFAYDSILSLSEGHTGSFVSNQPPMLGYMWNLLDCIGSGASMLILLSVAGFVSGSYLIFRRVFSGVHSLLLVILVTLFPPVFTQLGIINKETIASNFILPAFGCFIYFNQVNRKFILVTACSVLLALSVLVRYQYIIVICVLFSFVVIVFALTEKRWKKPKFFFGWVSICVGSFALFVFLFVALVSFTSRVNWFAPFSLNWRLQLEYDLAALMANYPGAASEYSRTLTLKVNSNALAAVAKAEYSPSTNVTLRRFHRLVGGLSTSELSRAVDQLSIKEPHALFRHRAEAYAAFLGLKKVCWPVQKRIPPLDPEADDPALFRSVMRLHNFSESIASRTVFQSKWLPANTFLFRPISYVILSIIMLAIMYFRDVLRKEILWIVSLPVSAFVYTLSFAPIVPSCDFRYSYWLLVTSIILATIMLFDWFASASTKPVLTIMSVVKNELSD